MNAIYLHPVDGFTFLENVPEKPENHPNFKSGMDQYSEPLETNGFWQKKLKDYERALAECIEKRLVIGNPEVIQENSYFKWKDGDVFGWGGTYEIKEEMYMTMPPKPTGYKVVTLIAPEKPTNFCSTFDRIKEEKLSTENSGFSIESKVCDKCGSVLQQTITTGLRIQKVEDENSTLPEELQTNYDFETLVTMLKKANPDVKIVLPNHEPVNSSIKLDPIRTVDEMQEVVNEGNSSMSEKEEFEATPKKKVPLSERLDNISRKVKERHATTVVEMDLLEAYQLGKSEPVVSQDQEPAINDKDFISMITGISEKLAKEKPSEQTKQETIDKILAGDMHPTDVEALVDELLFLRFKLNQVNIVDAETMLREWSSVAVKNHYLIVSHWIDQHFTISRKPID